MPALRHSSTHSLWPRTLLLLTLTTVVPDRAHACSKAFAISIQVPTVAHMIGTARADTVLAGPGEVKYRSAPGHFGPAVERTIYGQVVDVERLGGLAAKQLPPGTTRVVLVPWDYGADCQPTPWARSARWAEPGERGLFTAVLRKRADWAGGLPTFDVHDPDKDPFPGRSSRTVRGEALKPDSMLTVEQYFELANLLPTHENVRRRHAEALVPLLDWARANPALARRIPAREIISHNLYAAEGARIRSIIPPIMGTYRFEAVLTDRKGLPNGTPRAFYARTFAHADYGFDPIPSQDEWSSVDSLRARQAPGYYVRAVGATSIDSLPVDLSPHPVHREASLALLTVPEREGGMEAWRGRVEVDLVAQQFPADSTLQQFARAARDESFDRYQANLPYPTDARFIRSSDGLIVVSQAVRLKDGRTLTLKGERISAQVVKEPEWMWP